MVHGESLSDYAPAAHYDRVTNAWGLLLGDELHYGVFTRGDEELSIATGELTTRMLAAARLRAGQRVLDVGCGTGAPARRMVRDHNVEVLGISTSAAGVARAQELARDAGLTGASFEVRDGTDTGLPAMSFDVVWVMESSHLMPDRQELFDECSRVLRPGGRVTLCDVVRRREIPFPELRARRGDFAVLRAAFGAARMDQLSDYELYAQRSGFTDTALTDLTAETLPTFERWGQNVESHRADLERILGAAGIAEFAHSLEILRQCWTDGTLGYGLMSAVKAARA